MTSPMIVGIDPSITHTAICSGTASDRWSIETFKSKPLGDDLRSRMKRYEILAAKIDQHLRELGPALILIEDYSYGSFSSPVTQTYLAEWGGLLRWHLIERSEHVIEVAPTSLKKFITGKGSGKKEMMIAHVTRRWDQIFPTNDHVDAFALYQFGLVIGGQVLPRNQAEREAVDKALGGRRLEIETGPAAGPEVERPF